MRKAKRKRPTKKRGPKKTVIDATVTIFERDGARFMVLGYKRTAPPFTVLFAVKDEGARLEQLEAWNLDLKPEETVDWHRNRTALVIAGMAVGPALFSGKTLKQWMRGVKAGGGKA